MSLQLPRGLQPPKGSVKLHGGLQPLQRSAISPQRSAEPPQRSTISQMCCHLCVYTINKASWAKQFKDVCMALYVGSMYVGKFLCLWKPLLITSPEVPTASLHMY